MLEKDPVVFNKNKDLCYGKGGMGKDKEMTSKGEHKIRVNYDNGSKNSYLQRNLRS
jgi:hypothetical protein